MSGTRVGREGGEAGSRGPSRRCRRLLPRGRPARPSPPGAPQLCRGASGGAERRSDRPGLKVQGLLTSAPQTEVARVSNCLT